MIELSKDSQMTLRTTFKQEYDEENQELICQIHKPNKIIHVSLIENLDPQSRLLCAECLAEKEFVKCKSFNQQTKNRPIKKFLFEKYKGKVDNFKQTIDELKNSLNEKLDNIFNSTILWNEELEKIVQLCFQYDFFQGIDNFARQKLKTFEEEQIDKIQKTFQQCNYAHYNKISHIVQSLQTFQQYDKCTDALSSAIEKNQTKQESYRNIEVDEQGSHITPAIKATCSIHKREIIGLDLSEKIDKEERLACIECNRRNTINVIEFEQQWRIYDENKKAKQQKIQKLSFQSIDEISVQLKELKKQLTNNIDDLQLKLEQLLFQTCLRQADPISFDNENLVLLYQQMAQELSDSKFKRRTINEIDFYDSIQNMIPILFKKLKIIVEQIRNHGYVIKEIIQKQISFIIHPIKYQLVYQKHHKQQVNAIAFNNTGQIMVTTSNNDIIIWNFTNGRFQEAQQLRGHKEQVLCILYSKLLNQFISAGKDGTLKCWKQMQSKGDGWVQFDSQQSLQTPILILLMNKDEDIIISSAENKVQIWSIDQKANLIILQQQLEKHNGLIVSMSLNKFGTSLITSGRDKLLILWTQEEKPRQTCKGSKLEQVSYEWRFQQKIQTRDIGLRIYFLEDNLFAWSQQNQGVLRFYEIKLNEIEEKTEFCINLDSSLDTSFLFPIIYNEQKETLMLKHSKKLYIISKQIKGKFQVDSEPIELESDFVAGALTDDGNYLVLWNKENKYYKVYKIEY